MVIDMNNRYIINSTKPHRSSRILVLLTTVLILVMLITVPAGATSEPEPEAPPEIANFSATYANGTLSYSGEAADSVMAVAIILSGSDGTLVKADSVGVNPDMTFAGEMEIVLAEADTYTVSAANYEGGTITSVSFTYGTFNVIYELNGGTNNPSNPTTYNIEDEITLLDPTREGHTFAGWYNDSAFTEETTGWSAGTTGDVTVYAKWSIVLTTTPKTGESSSNFNLIAIVMLLFAASTALITKRYVNCKP
jgi:uncharacterized repeat protein (TIGR02543 family)/LPXTG-motif cell wall-anchored protein